MQRYLVVRPGAIGDAIVALPVVQRLKEGFSGASVDLVVSGVAADLLRGRCEADHVFNFDEARWAALFAEDMPPTISAFFDDYSAVILYAHRAGRSLAQHLGDRLIIWPPEPVFPLPISVHLQGALAALNITPRIQAPRLWLTEEDRDFADAFWRMHHLPIDRAQPVIAIHPGSGSPKKNWPATYYVALARRLQARYRAHVLLIVGPADKLELDIWMTNWVGEAPLVIEGLPLARVGGLLARCDCLIGNDSGIAHLAAALGVSTLVIFGPTDPRVWKPEGPVVAAATPETPCAPCTAEQRRLCSDPRCLKSIPIDKVYALALRYLEDHHLL